MNTTGTQEGNNFSEEVSVYKKFNNTDLLNTNMKSSSSLESHELKQTIKMYRRMFLMMAFCSATLTFASWPQINHVKNVLNATPSQMILFYTTTRIGSFLKPFIGHIEDKYPICGYKIKSYTLIYAIGSFLISVSIAFFNMNITLLCALVSTSAILECTGGALAEGMTAITLKYQKKLKELESSDKTLSDGANFGYLQVLGNFTRILCDFLGGFYGIKLEYTQVFLILGVFPCLLIFYSAFCFKEPKETKEMPTIAVAEKGDTPVLDSDSSICSKLIVIKGILLSDGLKYPMMLLLANVMVPTCGDFFVYLITDKDYANWTFEDLAFGNLANGIGYGILMLTLLSQLSKLPFARLLLLGGCLTTISAGLSLMIPYSYKFTYSEFFAVLVIFSLTVGVGSDCAIISIMGRFSSKCPKGLENLGVSTIGTLIVLAGIVGGYASSLLVVVFDVREGSYDNIRTIILITIGCKTAIFLLIPLLVRK